MVLSINWLRTLIICLALVSVIIGIVIRERSAYPDILTITLAAEVVTVFLYAEFAYRSKAETQFRGWRIFLRLIMAFLTVYGPATALTECSYYTRRDYDINTPGFHISERISCFVGPYDSWSYSDNLLQSFRLFRARCIITLTVCVLIVVELFCYGRSDEGTGRRPQVDAGTETRNDVELANTSVGDSQKMMVQDPPNATV